MSRALGFGRGVLSVALVLGMTSVSLAQPAGKVAPAPTDDLSLIPVDSELVGGLDWAQLQTSPLWQKHVEPHVKGVLASMPTDFTAACGDPMKAMTKISFGLKGLKGGSPTGVIVMHGVVKAKLVACMAKPTGAQKITRDGDYWIVSASGKDAAFTFLNDSTFLGVIGGNKDAVKRAASGGSALKTSPTFVELYKKTNTSDTLWLLLNGNSPLFDGLGSKMPVKPKAVFGSINVTRDLGVAMRIRVDSPTQANTLSSTLQGAAGQVGMFVDKLDIGSDGSDITINAAMSEGKLKALIGMAMGKAGP
jgi:hypothetical protein